MKHIYTICKGWEKPNANNTLQVETNKATAKREAKSGPPQPVPMLSYIVTANFWALWNFPYISVIANIATRP